MADVEKAELTQTPQENTNLSPTPPAYSNDPPPSYESVVGRIQDVRDTSTGKTDMAKKLVVLLFCNTVSMTLTIVMCIAVPIINIIMGAAFYDDCPKEDMIPLYLIVGGCFVMLRAFLNIAEVIQRQQSVEKEQRYERSMMYVCCDLPISLFLLVWFLAGNIWIFGIRDDFQSSDSDADDYCNAVLYGYAYWMTIVAWVMMLAPLALCCCVSCITCCGLCGGETKE